MLRKLSRPLRFRLRSKHNWPLWILHKEYNYTRNLLDPKRPITTPNILRLREYDPIQLPNLVSSTYSKLAQLAFNNPSGPDKNWIINKEIYDTLSKDVKTVLIEKNALPDNYEQLLGKLEREELSKDKQLPQYFYLHVPNSEHLKDVYEQYYGQFQEFSKTIKPPKMDRISIFKRLKAFALQTIDDNKKVLDTYLNKNSEYYQFMKAYVNGRNEAIKDLCIERGSLQLVYGKDYPESLDAQEIINAAKPV